MSSRRTTFRSTVRRRLCAALVLAAYLGAAVGFPVSAAPARRGAADPVRPCCCGNAGACCCSVPSAADPAPCCAGKTPSHQAKTDGDAARAGVRWVVSVGVPKCGGHATLWVTVGTALPPAAPFAWRAEFAPSEPPAFVDPSPPLRSCGPPTPPPRSRCL